MLIVCQTGVYFLDNILTSYIYDSKEMRLSEPLNRWLSK